MLARVEKLKTSTFCTVCPLFDWLISENIRFCISLSLENILEVYAIDINNQGTSIRGCLGTKGTAHGGKIQKADSTLSIPVSFCTFLVGESVPKRFYVELQCNTQMKVSSSGNGEEVERGEALPAQPPWHFLRWPMRLLCEILEFQGTQFETFWLSRPKYDLALLFEEDNHMWI